jgi:hypothetical protein
MHLLMAAETPGRVRAIRHDMILTKAVKTKTNQVDRDWAAGGRRRDLASGSSTACAELLATLHPQQPAWFAEEPSGCNELQPRRRPL